MGFEKAQQRCGYAAFLLMLACAPAWAGVCRVTTAGTVFNDGSSWAVPVSTAAPTAVGLGGAGSDPNCGNSAAFLYPYFYAFATVGMSVGLQKNLHNPTVGQSVCPAQ